MKKNKPYKTIVVLMSLTFLCGCWDIKEINQRALPLVMGISKEHDEEYRVTLSLPITNVEGKTRIVTGKGDSVSSVLGQMRTNSENALDYSQLQLIVIDSHLAANHPEWIKIIKYFMISKEIPSIALVAITDDNIEKMFSNISKLGFTGTAVYDFFNKGTGWAPEVSYTRIWEVYQSLFSYTNDIAVPVVNSAKDTILNFEGSAVLKNGKITERINPSENHLVRLFQNHTTIRNTENLGFSTIVVTDSSLKVKPSMKNNEPRVASDLSLKISILEKEEGVSNNRIKEVLEKRIEQRFNDIFKQAQKNKTDIFGFGQHFRTRISFDELKNWREVYYPKLIVNFQVHVGME
ncbi:germination protein, Ger(x)C family [Paenibacillus catalpae]|uniref:Germination protein, Ger(X)C family n=1 Tax=Paenibacillus catalpae TaxID=1045775 RepID=A0A1I2BXH0_9BACL|nr:Ger(x)C family spore germination protein [Paenibacillus catalpae]SFE60695.1 germination protein, Ger(x)C family [Paenibacillus catalpae]